MTGNTLFSYMVQKQVLSSKYNQTIKQLRQFLEDDVRNSVHQQSNIHHMEILDENADSHETMKHVTEILTDEFKTKSDWLILVGDGKTYERLIALKRQYGSELQHVLLFPGDWHILKKYQEVLMKIYFDARLKEMAKTSGFRGKR